MYLLNGIMMIVPAIVALTIHNYISNGKVAAAKKVAFFLLYLVVIGAMQYGLLWMRGIKGNGIFHITLSHKIELTLIGCIFAFCAAILVALLMKHVTYNKFKSYIIRFVTDIKKYYRYAIKSAKSDLRSEVANAYLDWLWWLIEPFCMMLIYTLIFGIIFNAAEQYFPVFIFLGFSMWSFFSRGMNVSVNIIRSNKSIISKVYLPKFILYLARMMVNGFKMLVSFGIVIVMMIFYKVPVTINIIYVVPIMLVFFLLTFGLGTILMHYGVYVNDLSYIVEILLRMLMYLTGIFYSIENRVPAPYGEILEQLNPAAYCIASVRNAVLYGKAPRLDLLVLWGILSVILSIIGVYTIYRNENAYVKVI